MAKKRKKEGKSPKPSERWLITYADMITLLLGVFIILAAMPSTSKGKFDAMCVAAEKVFSVFTPPKGSGQNPAFDKMGGAGMMSKRSQLVGVSEVRNLPNSVVKKRIEQSLPAEIGKGKIVVKPIRQGVLISSVDNLFFEPGSAEIKQEAHPALDRIGRVLEGIPNEVVVEGHTDATPISTKEFPSNWELSAARAANVLHYLLIHALRNGFTGEQLDAYQKRFGVAGYAQFHPIDKDPYSPANRRIDIIVISDKPKANAKKQKPGMFEQYPPLEE